MWFPSLRRSSSSSVFQVGVPITHEQLLIVPSIFLLPKFQPKFLFPFYAHVAIAIPILSPSLYLYLQARLHSTLFFPKKARHAKIGPQLTRFARISIASVPFFRPFLRFPLIIRAPTHLLRLYFWSYVAFALLQVGPNQVKPSYTLRRRPSSSERGTSFARRSMCVCVFVCLRKRSFALSYHIFLSLFLLISFRFLAPIVLTHFQFVIVFLLTYYCLQSFCIFCFHFFLFSRFDLRIFRLLTVSI